MDVVRNHMQLIQKQANIKLKNLEQIENVVKQRPDAVQQ
jgi:hypothetical protein